MAYKGMVRAETASLPERHLSRCVGSPFDGAEQEVIQADEQQEESGTYRDRRKTAVEQPVKYFGRQECDPCSTRRVP